MLKYKILIKEYVLSCVCMVTPWKWRWCHHTHSISTRSSMHIIDVEYIYGFI